MFSHKFWHATSWSCCTIISMTNVHLTESVLFIKGEGNLRLRQPPCEYLGEYTSRGKPKIPPADRILMDPGHKARKNPSDNADLGFQAVGPALCIMQHNVERLSAATKLNGGLSWLHSVDEDAVLWLTSYGSWHRYEKKKIKVMYEIRNTFFLGMVCYSEHIVNCWQLNN